MLASALVKTILNIKICIIWTKSEKCKSYIQHAKAAPDAEVLVGGVGDDSHGYFVHPTIIVTTHPHYKSRTEEIFGPILTVFVYPANKFEETLSLADSTSAFALTAALFAHDREAIVLGTERLRNVAGNFYVNDKSTGAVGNVSLLTPGSSPLLHLIDLHTRTPSSRPATFWWLPRVGNKRQGWGSHQSATMGVAQGDQGELQGFEWIHVSE
ncbi:1-pyrroline-5-carboxylate dehydrogenase [Gonapodya sp. JEL0774]|nr:1-pyrroline-5-carboxylate dehydrogenase [Gonapodya sp. JEL0774]